jgi:hypothetical protein
MTDYLPYAVEIYTILFENKDLTQCRVFWLRTHRPALPVTSAVLCQTMKETDFITPTQYNITSSAATFNLITIIIVKRQFTCFSPSINFCPLAVNNLLKYLFSSTHVFFLFFSRGMKKKCVFPYWLFALETKAAYALPMRVENESHKRGICI